MKNDSNIKAEHSLGKGEVDSSILSGSTRRPSFFSDSPLAPWAYSAVSGRTQRERDIAERGKSVDSVPGTFTHGGTMTDAELKTLRAKLTPIRNRMTTLINTIGNAIGDPELVESVRKQMAELNEALKKQEP